MSELKLVSPLLDGFAVGDPFSDHDGVRCYPAMKENSDDKYIVKVISIPASQKKLDALLWTGAYKNADAAAEYFKELAGDTVKEARLLQQLAKLEGFLSYEGWQIEPMDGPDVGYHVYLLGSYKRSLDKFLSRNPMTHLGAVNLGIDICTALSLCRRAGFIYTDLKPANIFISDQREYRIGDIGFAQLGAMKYTSMSEKYITRFTPPELHDSMSTLNPTVDTYALGMILYMIYNNGHIPFETKAPMMILPAPLNADYEIAEIILKACDPNPRKRYQTPVEMGKALVSYMQRNCINDVPIVPPGSNVHLEQAAQNQEPAVPNISADEPVGTEETVAEQEELQFLNELVSDDTAPGADTQEDLSETPMSDEVDMMLAQADELLQDPQIQAEDEDLPNDSFDEANKGSDTDAEDAFIDELLGSFDDEETENLLDHEENADDAEPAQPEVAEESDDPVTEVDDLADLTAVSDLSEEEASDSDADLDFNFSDITIEEESEDVTEEGNEIDLEFGLPKDEAVTVLFGNDDNLFEEEKPRKKKRGWVGLVIFLLILALLGGGAYYYYDNYYLLTIDNMLIEGVEDTLSIQLTTAADETLLRVECTDTYGNKQESPVSDGKVVFTGLNPDTMYKIIVTTDGFHKVTGSISGNYTTAEETTIVDFSAKGGITDGSVILNFTVDGPETPQWTIEYTAEGEQTQSVSFTGHMVTIDNLTIGKLYTFTLVHDGSAELYLDGNTSLEYLASKVIVAQNLAIVSCVDGVLTAQWNAPADATADGWTVRCYADDGYDETITVNETTAQFENINFDTAYTVEVTANGMSQSASAFVTANPATVTDVVVSHDANTGISITWKSTSNPDGGWLVMYSIDGSETTEMAACSGTTATVKNVIPNAVYSFQIMAADGSTVFGGNAEIAGIEATTFKKHGLAADQIQSSLCRTPAKEVWTYEDVTNNDYTTSYAPGESASVVLYATTRFYLENDETTVMFVIRNSEGKVLSNMVRTKTSAWRDLWPDTGKYCYLNIPVMPTEYGDYTLEIYFNGATVLTKNFSIISPIG